jgi:histone deacetylase 10
MLESSLGSTSDLKIKNKTKTTTGYCYDKRMELHQDKEFHIENPNRTKTILEFFQKNKLDKICLQVPSKKATPDQLKLVHTKEYVEGVLSIKNGNSKPNIHYDTDIYFNKFTVDATLLSAGCVVALVDKVMTGEITNGFAFCRPPGHHATDSKAQFVFVFRI